MIGRLGKPECEKKTYGEDFIGKNVHWMKKVWGNARVTTECTFIKQHLCVKEKCVIRKL